MKKSAAFLSFLLCFAWCAASEIPEHSVMLTAGDATPRVVDVMYNGVQRRMYYDRQGQPICHIIIFDGVGQDTAFFSTDGQYIALTKKSEKFAMVQDGSTDYTKNKTSISLGNAEIDIDPGSLDNHGNWQSATTSGRHAIKIQRMFFYGEDSELDAEIASLEARRDSFVPEFRQRYEQWQNNKVQGNALFLLMGIAGIILAALTWLLTISARPKAKYTIRTILGLPALMMCVGAVVFATFTGAMGSSSASGIISVIGAPIMIALPVLWFFVGRSFFRSMGREKTLSNTYIGIIEGVWTIFITVPLFTSCCSVLIPIPVIGGLVGLAAAFIVFIYQDVVIDRCPICRSINAYDEIGRTQAGTLTDVSKNSSQTHTNPRQVGDHLERERIDTKTTTTSVYQRWRIHMLCRYCGHRRSFTKTGELLSQIKHRRRTITEERTR